MKNIIRFMFGYVACVVMSTSAMAVSAGYGARHTNAPTARATVSKNQISAFGAVSVSNPTNDKSSIRQEPTVTPGDNNGGDDNKPDEPDPVQKDRRDKERSACMRNNIGIGNTFVWASRYTVGGGYATMVEDVDDPENNACFAKVELRSDDSRIKVSDIPAKYFEMGQPITCGQWADEAKLKQRILDAKKSGRTWGTVAGVVGSAAVGVGAMELFGNKLIGGAVEGQKAKNLSREELLRSQLLVLKKDNQMQYNTYVSNLREIKALCENPLWDQKSATKPTACGYDFAVLLQGL